MAQKDSATRTHTHRTQGQKKMLCVIVYALQANDTKR